MNASIIEEVLIAEGCNKSNFVVKATGSDVYCLDNRNGKWVVFYTERGLDSEPIYVSDSEESACNFFYNFIMNIQHWHIVGFFKTEAEAAELEGKLATVGIPSIRNDIPAYKYQNDPRLRVFVVGKDIFKFRDEFGEPRISYA